MANISFSLTDLELIDLRASAAAQGKSVSEYIRFHINPKTTKIEQAINDQKPLSKGLMVATSCMKKEIYSYYGMEYHYLYGVNHVFIHHHNTLYPVSPGKDYKTATASIGTQSILFAILCTIPLNGTVDNNFWTDFTTCFENLIEKRDNPDGSYDLCFLGFVFKREFSNMLDQYFYVLTERE